MIFATLTSKGQITIPKEVRNRLQLHSGDRLEFVWIGDELLIRPASRKVDEVFGKYKRHQAVVVSIDNMDAAIRQRFEQDKA